MAVNQAISQEKIEAERIQKTRNYSLLIGKLFFEFNRVNHIGKRYRRRLFRGTGVFKLHGDRDSFPPHSVRHIRCRDCARKE